MTSMDDIMMASTTEDPSYSSSQTTDGDYEYLDDLFCDRSSVREFRRHVEPPLFWLIAVVGGAGNLAVVWIYLNFRRRLKTMTDVYLLNLAVADLLFLVTLPLWAAEAAHGSWSFGSALCRLNSALYKVNLFSGVLLLTCISVDRYVVIVHTARAQNSQAKRRRCSRLVCLGVWLLALLLATPELVFASTPLDAQGYCRMVFPAHLGNRTKVLVLSLQVSVGFCLPLVVMATCYGVIANTLLKTRSFQKHKALRVVLAVAAAFLLTQLPYNGVLVAEAAMAAGSAVTEAGSAVAAMTACEDLKRLDKAGQLLKSLAYLHAGLNPFLYAFVGQRFQRDFLKLLHLHRRRPASRGLSKACRSQAGSRASDSDTSQALSL